MKVLNLYAGIGGNRKLWQGVEVTAVETDPKIAALYKRLYPDDSVIETDAHQYLLDHYNEFDFIWSSPPCQLNSKMVKFSKHKPRGYPDLRLYQEVIFLSHFFKGAWIVENVMPYYDYLIQPTKLIGRHAIWSNFTIANLELPNPPNFINLDNLKGKQALMDYLDIHFEEKIYYNGNHCPAQVLRNCVHPALGLHIFNDAMHQQAT